MKKIICLVSVFALFLSSCTHDDSTPGTMITLDDILVKYIFINGAGYGGSYQKFTYNGKKISKRRVFTEQTTTDVIYTYTGDLITAEEWVNVKQSIFLVKKYVYEYDSYGRLEKVRSQSVMPGSSLALYKKYTYNADGTVLENSNPNNQFTYYFNNGEIVKTVQVTPSSTTTLNYAYDNANTPFRNVIGFNKLTIFYRMEDWADHGFRSGYQHNLKSIISSTGDAIYKADYEYNFYFNFPVKTLFDPVYYNNRDFQYY